MNTWSFAHWASKRYNLLAQQKNILVPTGQGFFRVLTTSICLLFQNNNIVLWHEIIPPEVIYCTSDLEMTT